MEEVATKHDKIPTVSETGMRVTTSLGDGKNYGGIASYGNQRLNWFSEVGEVLILPRYPALESGVIPWGKRILIQ